MEKANSELNSLPATPTTITVAEIVARLAIGRAAVYELLERKEIPSIHFGRKRRWINSRRAYEQWEASIGTGVTELVERRPPGSETRTGVEASRLTAKSKGNGRGARGRSL
jgi:excisionase family DNA binding protein